MKPIKPVGKLTYVKTIVQHEHQNNVIVSATIVYRDEKGVEFNTVHRNFVGDLDLHSDKQKMSYSEWLWAVGYLVDWRLAKAFDEAKISNLVSEWYVTGVTVTESIDRLKLWKEATDEPSPT